MVLKNRKLLNPFTGKTLFWTEVQEDEKTGKTIKDERGEPVLRRTELDLFLMIRKSLGERAGVVKDWTADDLEMFMRISKRLQRELNSDKPIEGQEVTLSIKQHDWLKEKCLQEWKKMPIAADLMSAAYVALVGDDDTEDEEDE